MSLDKLQEHVRPKGPAETLCGRCGSDGFLRMTEPPCSPCGGTGVIVSPEVLAVREALWELQNVFCEDVTCLAGGTHMGSTAALLRTSHLHPEYVRRSRAEAALLLPDAAEKEFGPVEIIGSEDGWEVNFDQYPGTGQADNWLDALSVTVEARLKAQEWVDTVPL